MSLLNKIKKLIFGYDIFISYSRKDSLDYAYLIAQYFIKKGYESYIDQLSSITPGEELPPNIKDAVQRSSAFVLIGSEGAQASEAIEKEIQLFLDNNKNKPLIPVTVSGAINDNARWYKKIVGLALIDDTTENLKVGQPAQDILDRIENALLFTKKGTRLRNISLAIIIGVVTISGLAAYFTYDKTQEANIAILAKNQADRLKSEALKQRDIAVDQKYTAAKQKDAALKQRDIAVNEKRNSLNQMHEAVKLKIKADFLKDIALNDKVKAENSRNVAEKEVNHLNLQSEMIQYRIAAMRHLESDPLKAYRLTEEAYSLNNSEANSELIRSSLSSIDYFYKSVLSNYEITDFKEPYILLTKKMWKAIVQI